ncbi:uncharacterized protein LOC141537456 isoform X1 [Cotesia typhae]|uniref:uncharacterized protein LOC141537456 isoform X1 n=1 Tax=Cotesia typhae TaxID=2053667 RepID=UPI003D686518
MATKFEGIPDKFDSYENLEKWLNNYEKNKKNKFNVFVSESLYKVYQKRSYVEFNPQLIYDRIKFKCSTHAKHDHDMPNNCSARLELSTSPNKQHLEVDDFDSHHNHADIIIGRRGPIKRKRLLLESAVKLHQEMEERKP